MNEPQSDLDWTTRALNIQGTFFERWCYKTISEQDNWKVRSYNYPVSYPKQNGPFLGQQSTLDILARIDKQTIRITLLIECKKNNNSFINWVFFFSPQ